MSRRRSEFPKLIHHRARNQARVRIEGREFCCGTWGTEKAEQTYRRIVGEYISSGKLPESPRDVQDKGPLTVNELILLYWNQHVTGHYVKNGSATSEQEIIRQTLKVLRQHYGMTPAVEFGPVKLKAVRKAMIGKGWCRESINQRVNRIRRLFRWGVSEELVPESVWNSLRAVTGLQRGRSEARESEPVAQVEEATVNATIACLPQVVADMVRVQLLTGARPGEICGLRPCDIDRSGDVWEYRVSGHKTEHHQKERRIYFGPKAQAILLRYLDNRAADEHCFQPGDSEEKRNAKRRQARTTKPAKGRKRGVKRRRFGDRYTKDTYRRAVTRGCELAFGMPDELRDIRRTIEHMEGLSKAQQAQERTRLQEQAAVWRKEHCWSPNQLRHSRGTMLRRDFGIEAAQIVLGHADPKTTLIYAETDFRKAREIMAEVG